MTRETKQMGGRVTETKIKEVNGVKVGEISGYIAAWTVDEGLIPDRFVRGAFARSIGEHRKRGNRQVRFKDHHGRTVGGWPIETVREDEIGLFGTAQVNLEVQQGREAFSLARQRVLVDLSVGFTAKQRQMVDGVRIISDADLNEGSIVDEPMNRDAQIIEVKNMALDLPIHNDTWVWDVAEAQKRVLDLSFREVKGLDPYIGDLLVADVVDQKLVLIPEAVQIAAAELKSQSEPNSEQVRLVERLLAKMNLPSPFDEDGRQFFGVDDVKGWGLREVEQALVKSGAFSNGAAKMMVKLLSTPEAKAKGETETGETDFSDILEGFQALANTLRG